MTNARKARNCLELSVNTHLIQRKNLQWTFSANAAYNHNEITDMGATNDVIQGSDKQQILRRGEPLIAPGPDGLNELAISNAAYLSAWQGGIPVRLPMDEDRVNRLLDEHQATSRAPGDASAESAEISGEYSERWQVKW